jgi:hypothetical protein
MPWTKQGLIYCPRGRFGWDQSHAAVPTVDVVDDRVWRVYYSSRDQHNRSRTSYVDVDATNRARVLYVHPEPILPLGRPGTFDDSGITWKTWYRSCIDWVLLDGRMEPKYHLKYAESDDGTVWRRNGIVAVELKSEHEGGLAKPSVLCDRDGYRMWYCFRNQSGYRIDRAASYRIGYAESLDGVRWVRSDSLAGIDVSDDGWDSEMVAYPHVVAADRRDVMFYNGKGFGRTGFGFASQN